MFWWNELNNFDLSKSWYILIAFIFGRGSTLFMKQQNILDVYKTHKSYLIKKLTASKLLNHFRLWLINLTKNVCI